MRAWPLVVLGACTQTREPAPSPSPPPPAPAPAPAQAPEAIAVPAGPTVKLVAWDSDTARFLAVSPTAVTEVRKVTLPGPENQVTSIDEIVWLGPEVFVRYDTDRVGRITDRGFEPLPAVPGSKWRKKAPAGMERVSEEWTLEVTANGAWLGHCGWGATGPDDRNECLHWEHVRVFPGKPVKMEPDGATPAPPPVVKPTRTTTSTFQADLATILRCTRDGKTVEIPAAGTENRAYGISGEPTWLSAEPAMFVVTLLAAGDPTTESQRVFENCQETPYTTAVRGPAGVFALTGGDGATSIRRDGREVGTIEEPQVAFAR